MKRIVLFPLLLLLFLLPVSAEVWQEMEVTAVLPLQYATEFWADYYEGDYVLLSVTDGSRYLVIPEGKDVPEGLDADITVLRQPIDNIYMVATSAMDLYRAIGGIDRVRFSCLQESGWYVEEARQAMANGDMIYAGKYSAPDYELLLGEGCGLAVESTMIYHVPEVKEMLELLEIPVVIERSSRETDPLGRMEWMKFHALILGCIEDAMVSYAEELEALSPILEQESTGKTVAFFAVNDDGTVTVRKSSDYIAKTISLAGGEYIFSDFGTENDSQTTVTVSMETFYDAARDADILICSSTMVGELGGLDALLDRSDLLADFRAFREGNVWCTHQNLFQSTMGLGDFLMEIHSILTEEAGNDMAYLYRLT